jgi:hypothetical protein
MDATHILSITSQFRAVVLASAAERSGGFSNLLIRQFKADSRGNRDAGQYSKE